MAQGNAITFYKAGLANNGTVDIAPGFDQGASGDQWVIHELYVGGQCQILWTNGTVSIVLAAPTAAKWFTNLFSHCVNANRLRILNNSGGAIDVGYSGIQTK